MIHKRKKLKNEEIESSESSNTISTSSNEEEKEFFSEPVFIESDLSEIQENQENQILKKSEDFEISNEEEEVEKVEDNSKLSTLKEKVEKVENSSIQSSDTNKEEEEEEDSTKPNSTKKLQIIFSENNSSRLIRQSQTPKITKREKINRRAVSEMNLFPKQLENRKQSWNESQKINSGSINEEERKLIENMQTSPLVIHKNETFNREMNASDIITKSRKRKNRRHSKLESLRKRVRELEQELSENSASIIELTERIESIENPSRRSNQSIRERIEILSQRIEQNEKYTKKFSKSLRKNQRKLDEILMIQRTHENKIRGMQSSASNVESESILKRFMWRFLELIIKSFAFIIWILASIGLFIKTKIFRIKVSSNPLKNTIVDDIQLLTKQFTNATFPFKKNEFHVENNLNFKKKKKNKQLPTPTPTKEIDNDLQQQLDSDESSDDPFLNEPESVYNSYFSAAKSPRLREVPTGRF